MRELIIRLDPPLNSVFDECETSVMVKKTGEECYDVELYILRTRPDSYQSLRVSEARDVDAETVDYVLDTWLGKLMNRGWRTIKCDLAQIRKRPSTG